MKRLNFILLFTLSVIVLHSITIEVKQDGTGDYTQIQDAIDASTNGDIVLVYPGTYYENLTIEGKNLTLASLEYPTGDESYIEQTIIDGSMHESVIFINGGFYNILIQGFIICNGKGKYIDDTIGHLGGGIFIDVNNNLQIKNCIIKNNYAELGGGIYTSCNQLSLENVTIRDNHANSGGGIFDGYHTNFIFSSNNRSNIYNNDAGSGRDLFAIRVSYDINVIVDTFTVMNPDSYYACHLNDDAHFSFDIQHSFIEPIDADMYVSPDGSDENSGLTPNDPLQTISWAMQLIKSNPDNLHTIHLASGTYSQSLNNQFYPIGMKSYVTLQGENGENPPILLNEGVPETESRFFGNSFQVYFSLKNLILHQATPQSGYIIFFRNIQNNIELSNLKLENMEFNTDNGIFKFSNINHLILNNITIKNITNSRSIGPYCLDSNVTAKNCVWENNNSTNSGYDSVGYPGFYITAKDSVILENCKFINNQSSADWGNIIAIQPQQFCNPEIVLKNVLCANNQTVDETAVIAGPYNINEEEIEKQIINCTFANNTSSSDATSFIGKTRLINSIFHNYTNNEIFLPDMHQYGIYSELTVDHCLIQGGGSSVINENGVNTVNWLDGNISSNPQLIGEGDYPFALSSLSPCIDAGTTDLPDGVELPETDLAGNSRVVGSSVDIGAYEYQGDEEANQNEISQPKYTRLKVYPNPFRIGKSKLYRSTFSLKLAKGGKLNISVYNLKGQKIITIMDAVVSKGVYKAKWDGKDDNKKYVATGVYFCKVMLNNRTIRTKRFTIIKE